MAALGGGSSRAEASRGMETRMDLSQRQSGRYAVAPTIDSTGVALGLENAHVATNGCT